MRPFLCCCCLLASAITVVVTNTAYAGAYDTCQQKEKEATGLRTCIEAERNQAAGQLRSQNKAASAAVEKMVQAKRDRALLNQFRAQQARHLRNRQSTCRKQPSKNEQVACEADMDFAHAEELKRYTKA